MGLGSGDSCEECRGPAATTCDICGASICEDCSIDGACSICAEEELCESCGCEASDLFYCDGCGRWVCWDCYSEDGGRCEECLSSPRPVG